MTNMVDLILIPFFLLLFLGIRENKTTNVDVFGIGNSNALKGIFSLVILFGHIITFNSDSILFCRFNNMGAFACSIFFFISGYGLFCQYYRNTNYLNGFLKSRIIKLLLPALIISIVYIIFKIFLYYDYNIKSILRDSLKGHTPIIDNSWYIIEIILLYLFFYVVLKLCDKLKVKNKNIPLLVITLLTIVLMLIFIVCKWGSNWYVSTLSFPLGALVSTYNERFKAVLKKYKYGVIICCSFFVICATYYNSILSVLHLEVLRVNSLQIVFDILSKLLFCFIIYAALCIITIKSSVIEFVASISYELYMLHGLFIVLFTNFIPISNDLLRVTVITICSIISAYIFNCIDKTILGALLQRTGYEV